MTLCKGGGGGWVLGVGCSRVMVVAKFGEIMVVQVSAGAGWK